LKRKEEQANSVFSLGEILIILWMKKIVKFLDGKFWKFFFTINSTNFAIVWGKKYPNFQYHKNIRKKEKRKKEILTTMQKKGG
jgi:hypothetical protein